MKLIITKGATSVGVNVFIRDNSVTTGAGLTGLAYNTASLTAYYSRQNAAKRTTEPSQRPSGTGANRACVAGRRSRARATTPVPITTVNQFGVNCRITSRGC